MIYWTQAIKSQFVALAIVRPKSWRDEGWGWATRLLLHATPRSQRWSGVEAEYQAS